MLFMNSSKESMIIEVWEQIGYTGDFIEEELVLTKSFVVYSCMILIDTKHKKLTKFYEKKAPDISVPTCPLYADEINAAARTFEILDL